MNVTLYRAADDDSITGLTCFSPKKSVAREYQNNRGFGGANLYRAEVECDDAAILDIRSECDADQVAALVELTGIDMGSVTADWLVVQERVAEALVSRGYRWVRLLDTYPVGAETWVYLYDGEDPELEQI